MNEKTLLLHYNDSSGTREEVRVFLDSRPEIKNWVCYLPHSYLVITDLSPRDLSLLFLRFAGEKSMFMVINLTESICEGWMPKAAWDLVREPVQFTNKPILP